MIPKNKIKDKVIEIEIKEFNNFVNYVNNLKEMLRRCQEVNNYLNKQIEAYNKTFTKDK